MQSAQSGVAVATGEFHRVGAVHGHAREVALVQPDALPVEQVDGRNDFHGQ
jgi:hypothetical protein